MTATTWWWGAAAILCSGCMTAAGSGEVVRASYRLEGSTEVAGWKRVHTPDFVLLTDLPDAQARRATLLLGQSLDALAALFARAPVKTRRELVVVAMADTLDFERRFGRRTGGLKVSVEQRSVLFLQGPPDRWFTREELAYEAGESVVLHELAHAVLDRYFPAQPRWFAEGMAEFLETVRWKDDSTVIAGDVNLGAYRTYRAIRSVDITAMVGWRGLTGRELDTAGLYAMSWAFIHFALNREPQLLARYMSTLAEKDADTAWRATFAGRPGALDADIFQYMKAGQYRQLTIAVPPRQPSVARVEPASAEELRFKDEVAAAVTTSLKQ